MRETGRYETVTTVGEPVRAFIPHPLPPVPPLEISPQMRDAIEKALLDLGRLDGMTSVLPDTRLFLYMYVRKEAVLSSQIEGTQSRFPICLYLRLKAPRARPLQMCAKYPITSRRWSMA